MVDPTAQISTPLAQLRAQAAAAKLAEATAPVAAPIPVQAPVVAVAHPAPVVAPATAPALLDDDSIPDLSAVVAAPVTPAKSPVATPACALAPSRSLGSLCSFVSLAQLKFGLAVAIVFFLASMLPVDALVRRFSFLGKLPFANTLLKALTAGVAVTAMSPCIQDAR